MPAAADIGEVLCRELGTERVIRPGNERLDEYGRDRSPLGAYPPECAVLCDSREQAATVLRIAAERRVPVTPRGAGSGKTGGCLPVAGGIVLSTERMNTLVEVDPGDLVAVAQPGVITGDLQQAAAADGLFYPPDPASLGYCSLGGNVATGAGGPRAFKYGVTRDYVIGLEVVLMGGETLRLGRRTSKGVTGYDLAGGFVGSEGTFGVITEITVKLLPAPPVVSTFLAVFRTMDEAGAAVDAIIHSGLVPRTLEIADRQAIEHVRPHARYRFPDRAGAIVLVELDGDP
ncbi:MAG: FAD-binding protein, partial [Myxococcota bacterium]